jgi:hypothetical protein
VAAARNAELRRRRVCAAPIGATTICPVGTPQARNVFEAIAVFGHDFDFEPSPAPDFEPTDAMPGSLEKMAVIIDRLERGLPLHHPQDRVCCDGLSDSAMRELAGRVSRPGVPGPGIRT